MTSLEPKGLLDPKTDFIFKQIFGQENTKSTLISFLNALLKGNPKIESVTLENTEISKILKEDKGNRLDVRARTDDDTMIDIEIQCKNTGEIPSRAIHYIANMFPHILKSNETYNKSHVIGIWILGENVTKRKKAISEAYWTFQDNDEDEYEIVSDNSRLFFIELQKFNPKKGDAHDLLTAWLAFLQNPTYMDDTFLDNQEVQCAMTRLKYISADDKIRALADLRQRTANDRTSEMNFAVEKALEEGKQIGLEKGEQIGLEKGREEGAYQKALETACKMLSKGMDMEDVADLTGLSIAEIETLK